MSNNSAIKHTEDGCVDEIDYKCCINCDQSLSFNYKLLECNENKKHKGCGNCMTMCLKCDIDMCRECIDNKSGLCKECLITLSCMIKISKGKFDIENENYKICLSCNDILFLDYNNTPCYNNYNHKKTCEDCTTLCKNCLEHYLCIDCSNKNDGLCKKCLPKKINYKRGDLFKDKVNHLVHCVSEDFVMGAGIAKFFKKYFKRENELKNQQKKVGEFSYLKVDNREIYYLITKKKYNDKPTLSTLRSSLKNLKDHMKEHKLFNLSMPKIGCGLDKLDLEDVELIILDIFSEKEWKINVFEL